MSTGRRRSVNREEVWRLHDLGYTRDAIAELMGISKSSVQRVLADEGRPSPKPTPQVAPQPQVVSPDGGVGIPLDPMVAAIRVSQGEGQELISQSADPEQSLKYLRDLALASKNTAEAEAKRPPKGIPPQEAADAYNHLLIQVIDNNGRVRWGYDEWLDWWGDVIIPELEKALKDEYPKLYKAFTDLEDDDDVG